MTSSLAHPFRAHAPLLHALAGDIGHHVDARLHSGVHQPRHSGHRHVPGIRTVGAELDGTPDSTTSPPLARDDLFPHAATRAVAEPPCTNCAPTCAITTPAEQLPGWRPTGHMMVPWT